MNTSTTKGESLSLSILHQGLRLTTASGVKKATQNARKNYPGLPVVFSGGVAANSMLRSELSEFSPIFCEPQFSTDNAMGVAILAHRCQEG
jgi:N6-L-threonylcarbamoyladenine synthase